MRIRDGQGPSDLWALTAEASRRWRCGRTIVDGLGLFRNVETPPRHGGTSLAGAPSGTRTPDLLRGSFARTGPLRREQWRARPVDAPPVNAVCAWRPGGSREGVEHRRHRVLIRMTQRSVAPDRLIGGDGSMLRAVVLDRDGVIRHADPDHVQWSTASGPRNGTQGASGLVRVSGLEEVSQIRRWTARALHGRAEG